MTQRIFLVFVCCSLSAASSACRSQTPAQPAEPSAGEPVSADPAPEAWPPLPPASPDKPDLVLITIDALRADHLTVYGYTRDTSPNLKQFADQALVFEHAVSHASETQVSMPSLLSGRFPSSDAWEELPSGASLAARLKAQGYHTFALVSNHWLNPARGYASGFDHYQMLSYVYPPRVGALAVADVLKTPRRLDGSILVKDALRFLHQAPRPRFLWLHLMDVHNPYQPPPGFWGRFGETVDRDRYTNGPLPPDTSAAELRHLIARYDEGIAYTDALLQPLLEHLSAPETRAQTWSVITADHGEALGEHGQLGHGSTLYLEELHVPLLIASPSIRPGAGRVARGVALWDLAPTLLGAAGLAPDPTLEGRDLRGLMAHTDSHREPPSSPDRLLPAAGRSLFDQRGWSATLEGPWHLVRPPDSAPQLFRWLHDPAEVTDLYSTMLPQVTRLAQQLDALLSSRPARRDAPPIDALAQEKLKAIGYVGTP